MATNKLTQENTALANSYGIAKLEMNRKQRGYYPIHLRKYANLLKWIMIINTALLIILLYLFFTQPAPAYYATAFSGKNTKIPAYALQQARQNTQQNQGNTL